MRKYKVRKLSKILHEAIEVCFFVSTVDGFDAPNSAQWYI